MSPRGSAAPVAAVPVALAAFFSGPGLPLVLGLLGVILARIAFTTRQQRAGKRPGVLEFLSITGLAMLMVGPIIWEHKLGMTTSALMGIGSGWSSIQIVDKLGDRMVDIIPQFLNVLIQFLQGVAGGTKKEGGDDGALTPSPSPKPSPMSDGELADRLTGVHTGKPMPGDMMDLLDKADRLPPRDDAPKP